MLEDEEVEALKGELEDAFSDYYELAGGKNFRYHHLVRTHRYVKRMMEREELEGLDFDPEVVEVAALFHDIGRKEDIEDGYMDPMKEDGEHAERGAEMVSEYIEDFLDQDQVRKVETVIRNHHSDPETDEGKIVQDCDALSNFGVNNLWRMIHYSAEKERTIDESLEYFWNEALQQYRDKMDDLNLEISKEIAEKRIERHRQLMEDMEKEIEGADI